MLGYPLSWIEQSGVESGFLLLLLLCKADFEKMFYLSAHQLIALQFPTTFILIHLHFHPYVSISSLMMTPEVSVSEHALCLGTSQIELQAILSLFLVIWSRHHPCRSPSF